jgi:hypothetical protein
MPRLFVKGISERIGNQELEDIFSKYGKVEKTQSGAAGFAFVVSSVEIQTTLIEL